MEKKGRSDVPFEARGGQNYALLELRGQFRMFCLGAGKPLHHSDDSAYLKTHPPKPSKYTLFVQAGERPAAPARGELKRPMFAKPLEERESKFVSGKAPKTVRNVMCVSNFPGEMDAPNEFKKRFGKDAKVTVVADTKSGGTFAFIKLKNVKEHALKSDGMYRKCTVFVEQAAELVKKILSEEIPG